MTRIKWGTERREGGSEGGGGQHDLLSRLPSSGRGEGCWGVSEGFRSKAGTCEWPPTHTLQSSYCWQAQNQRVAQSEASQSQSDTVCMAGQVACSPPPLLSWLSPLHPQGSVQGHHLGLGCFLLLEENEAAEVGL